MPTHDRDNTTKNREALALAQKIDRTAKAETASLLGGLALLPIDLRRIILGAIVRNLTAALVEMQG